MGPLPASPLGSPSTPTTWQNTVDHSLAFFTRVAATAVPGAYRSEIDAKGQPTSDAIHVLALSRLLYAQAVAGTWAPPRREEARATADFLRSHFVGEERHGRFFHPTLHLGTPPPKPSVLPIWEQAYGLCGLVEFYRQAPSDALLNELRALHQAFIARYSMPGSDYVFGMDYQIEEGRCTGAGYASIVYPLSAYMIALAEVDPAGPQAYTPVLRAGLAQAAALWDDATGWVREHSGVPDRAVPGHSFQLAWLFLRVGPEHGLSAQETADARTLGFRILDRTLAQPAIWDDAQAGLWASITLPAGTPSGRKDWWPHAEALPALALAHHLQPRDGYAKAWSRLADFYLTTFFDHDGGGEWFAVDQANRPLLAEPKGAKGKSSYHVAEAARYLLHYGLPANR